VEREPVVESVSRQPVVGEADRMAPPSHLDVTLPSGTDFEVRLDQRLDTRTNRAGDTFSAVLMRPVTVNGKPVLPLGTPFSGHVTNSSNSGRFKGRAVIAVKLDSFRLRGLEYHIDTNSVSRESEGHKKRNLLLPGLGSGVGAAIGAITGGGKDAPAGALAGGGAGAGGAAAAGKFHVEIARETALTFTLKHAVAM
jgi:hypothetical protein